MQSYERGSTVLLLPQIEKQSQFVFNSPQNTINTLYLTLTMMNVLQCIFWDREYQFRKHKGRTLCEFNANDH